MDPPLAFVHVLGRVGAPLATDQRPSAVGFVESGEAIDAFAGLADPEGSSPLLLMELRQLGRALGQPAENGSAISQLDASFVMLGIGLP